MSETKKVRLKDGYGLPYFAIGTVRFHIETIDGEPVMTLAIGVRGEDRETQQKFLAEQRVHVARYCDLINKGIELEALQSALKAVPASQEG